MIFISYRQLYFWSSSSTLFQCSFERTASPDQLCGMTQDRSDQFDWTVHTGSTPTQQTGPAGAFDQRYYVYIETSARGRSNDEARLILPRVNYIGSACVDFYYHMFGRDINKLKVIHRNPSTTSEWSHSVNVNRWIHGFLNVTLQSQSTIQIVALRGAGPYGDIAVDRVQVTTGSCRFN